MLSSSTQRFINHVNVYEEKSKQNINSENFYCIYLKPTLRIGNSANSSLDKEEISKLAESLLHDFKFACVYVCGITSLVAVISPLNSIFLHASEDMNMYYFEDCSFQTLASNLSSFCTLQTKTLFSCNVVEFKSSFDLFGSLIKKMEEYVNMYIQKISGLRVKKIKHLTFLEIQEHLEKKKNIKWKNIPEEEKYGFFVKKKNHGYTRFTICLNFIGLDEQIKKILY